MMTTPGTPEQLAKAQKFDLEKNDAELMVEIERASGQPLKKLNKDLYPIRSITVNTKDRLVYAYTWDDQSTIETGELISIKLNNPFAEERVKGYVEGLTPDGKFVVVNGRRYSTLLEITRA